MSLLLPGTKVLARGLPWEVVEVEPVGEQSRYRLRGLHGVFLGQTLDLLSPFEHVQPIATELNPKLAGPIGRWLLYHQAFLLDQALGPDAFLATQPGRLDIAPYQLVPVMRALRMSRPRLLLADGVGLGKTIQAGLVLTEMIARRRAHRILVVSPAGPLLDQWDNELRNRFGLRFTILRDWDSLQEERRKLVLGANPFDQVSYCLTSIDFAKQEKVLQDLDRSVWHMVVIDEAHHCVRLGSTADAEASRRRKLAEFLARQSDGLLLLTATPQVANLRLELLAIAVDTTVALLEAVGVVGEFKVNEMVAAIVEVQALGSRVGADEDDLLVRSEALGDARALLFAVSAADRKELARKLTALHRRR